MTQETKPPQAWDALAALKALTDKMECFHKDCIGCQQDKPLFLEMLTQAYEQGLREGVERGVFATANALRKPNE
jgi:hypothetical protein